MDLVLSIGAIVFAFTTIYFFFTREKKFNSAMLVSFVTMVSYLVMLQGDFITQASLGGADLYWTRWVFYAFSCTLLMYMIGKKLKFPQAQSSQLMYLTAIVMITGVLASISMDLFKWVFFAISTMAYAMMIEPILAKKTKAAKLVKPFIIFGWSVFPIVFLLSPEGINFFANELSAWIYLGLDLFTKIYFYLVIDQKDK